MIKHLNNITKDIINIKILIQNKYYDHNQVRNNNSYD